MEAFKNIVNGLSYPQWSFTLSLLVFVWLLWSRRLWTRTGGLLMLLAGVAFFSWSLLDRNFRSIVGQPDNLPIVMMMFLVVFFLWLSMSRARRNDAAKERGEPTFEEREANDLVFTWPDLVFIELICMVLLTVGLLLWSLSLEAPLTEPANPLVAPNPAKAPWYFLGLQEMLVYFDPWFAGVVLPAVIVLGLLAIPYIDTNPRGNGYFTFRERRTEISLFLFGFLFLWCQLIVIGTFLRGPNWSFFGPFEPWDANKVVPLVNVDFADLVWIGLLGIGLPSHWLPREIFGILFVVLYLFVLPVALGRTRFFGRLYERMGPARYYVTMMLFLLMLLLPLKMYLRWLFNLRYILHLQEFNLNI